MIALLRDRNGRRYLIGQLLSVFGDTALWLAAGIWVKTLTGSNALAGLTFFAFSAPTVLAPAAGLFVDRMKKRPLLVATDLALGAGVLLLLLVHGRDQVWLIYLVMVLYGVAYGVLGSGELALLREMLPEELLGNANGLLQTFRQGIRLVGPVAGAGLFAWKGGGAVAIVDACTFLVAAVATFSLHVNEEKPARSEHHWFDEVTAGIRHAWTTTVLRQILTACLLIVIPLGFFETIAFAVVGIGLHEPPTFLGIIASAQGVGAIAGGLTAAAVMKRTNEGALFAFACLLFAASSLLLTLQWIPGRARRCDRDRRMPSLGAGCAVHAGPAAHATGVAGPRVLGIRHADRTPADHLDRGRCGTDRIRRLPSPARLLGSDGGARGGVSAHA